MTWHLRTGRSGAFWTLLSLLATGLVGNAQAFERQTWLAVTGMLSTYDMSEVNSGIQDLGVALLGGVFVDEIPAGLGFGFGLGTDVTSRFAIGLDYDRYTARASGEGTNSDLQTGRVEIAITLPANAISGSVEIRHHGGQGVDLTEEGRWNVGAGVSGGVIWLNGELKVTTDSNGVETTTLSGAGLLMEGFLAADIWQSPRLGFGTSAGYRYAQVDSPEMQSNGAVVSNATLASVDYSGLFVQVAIKFALR